jgi:hypothetical protein
MVTYPTETIADIQDVALILEQVKQPLMPNVVHQEPGKQKYRLAHNSPPCERDGIA